MKERPILFSGPMVRAILEGRKTMTRRVVKGTALEWLAPDMFTPEFVANPENYLCPYGQPGDRLWVRETWGVGCRPDPREGWVDGIEYRADQAYVDEIEDLPLYPVEPPDGVEIDDYVSKGWRPSIFMPRWASRITLEITAVLVERLQDISDEDAEREGVDTTNASILGYCRERFRKLWDSINAKPKPIYEGRRIVSYVSYPWDDLRETRTHRGKPWVIIGNPWVWVVEFKRVKP